MATATAENTPMIERKGMPATLRPTSATTTVAPATTTAEPAVAVARAADSSASMPVASWSRCRLTMNRE